MNTRRPPSAGVIILFFMPSVLASCRGGPDLSRYDILKDPRIGTMPRQKMIVVELKGDPNEVGGKAFGALFKTYYGLKEQAGNLPRDVAPRARWPEPPGTPEGSWVGLYGLPVPESVTKLPDEGGEGVKVRLEVWEYGDVAEILHTGPYGKEKLTIQRLRTFIEDQGYEIDGPHEEEYLKGPGMFFKGDPETYKTIIRYAVKKVNP